ncbi:MAG: hypothetical protein PHH93_07985 [Prolixibacteraceae bacterium]|nr:hypothetical protein [Prolixibacteraceae bacterium]
MKKYYYLVFTPEAFIASHLSPVDFGYYLSVGTKKRVRGQNIYFELDPSRLKKLPEEYLNRKLVPYPDGEPKRSVFFGIYRVLEKTPLSALKNLYLATDDGKVLELLQAGYEKKETNEIHLYQQFNPITTRVASKLSPHEFIEFLTNPDNPVSTPKLFFADLLLNELANDPTSPLHNLPYPNPDHLRECLLNLHKTEGKLTKTVLRFMRGDISFRTIKNGFYVGKKQKILYYPFPSVEELESKYFNWWRSALIQHF